MDAFATDEVMEYEAVVQKYKKLTKRVLFGTARALCHEKHGELLIHLRSYKGRVVFRGDIVKDAHGYYAVFSEQGASASHMAATKFLDALARCLYCDGEDSDAVGAYTQVRLDQISHLPGASLLTHGCNYRETDGQPRGESLTNLFARYGETCMATSSQASCGKSMQKKR